MNILLIAGGWSNEREVSLSGAIVIKHALEHLGHNVTNFDPLDSLYSIQKTIKNHDFAFINMHGSPGEDGLIQSILELENCPYNGSNSTSSIISLNKFVSKIFFSKLGLTILPDVFLTKLPDSNWIPPFEFPIILKNNHGGSSISLKKIDSRDYLHHILKESFTLLNQEWIIEKFLPGFEVTCGVLGNLDKNCEIPIALPPILIKPLQNNFFDYKSKYEINGAEEICPAPITSQMTHTIQQMALKVHTGLSLSGYSRADFIIPPHGNPVVLEVNTLPGMTPTSLFPKAAAAYGLSFPELIQRIIDLGIAKYQKTVQE
jgi:D-alanine-D-alanine ligase